VQNIRSPADFSPPKNISVGVADDCGGARAALHFSILRSMVLFGWARGSFGLEPSAAARPCGRA